MEYLKEENQDICPSLPTQYPVTKSTCNGCIYKKFMWIKKNGKITVKCEGDEY